MRSPFLLATLALCAACSGEGEKAGSPSPMEPEDGCARGTLESDIVYTPMTGPKVEGGKLAAPSGEGYVASSTFLRLKPGDETNTRFQELLGPILAGFPSRPGMQAFQLALAASCNTARTLSVWASVEDMYDFVTSEEHMTAVSAVGEVSRGGSIVVHWDAATAEETSWQEAARKLAAATGPFY